MLVLANRSLCVDLFDEIENNRYHDEECCTTDSNDRDTRKTLQNDRQHCEQSEEEGSDERDARDHIGEIFSCILTRTDARDEGAVL